MRPAPAPSAPATTTPAGLASSSRLMYVSTSHEGGRGSGVMVIAATMPKATRYSTGPRLAAAAAGQGGAGLAPLALPR